jgi:hypothetical protein
MATVAAVAPRLAILLAAVVCGPLAAHVGPAGGAAAACQPLKETSLHWDAVFAHVSSLSQAIVIRKQIAHYGFKNVDFEQDWCDDVEILIAGVDAPAQQRAFFEEAFAVGFSVSFEPPYTYRKPHRGYVKAIFATLPTLSRANTLQRALATKGYRQGTDIERLDARHWRVVLYRIPVREQQKFTTEARAAGFSVEGFER